MVEFEGWISLGTIKASRPMRETANCQPRRKGIILQKSALSHVLVTAAGIDVCFVVFRLSSLASSMAGDQAGTATSREQTIYRSASQTSRMSLIADE